MQWGPALFLCYKIAMAKANTLVYEAGRVSRGNQGGVGVNLQWVDRLLGAHPAAPSLPHLSWMGELIR